MKTIDALKLTLPKFPMVFARGRAAQATLAPFPGADDVLTALALSSETTAETRAEITLALIAEHRRTRHSFWQSLLLVAYEPLLANVWRRLIDRRDAESKIALAFLEAVEGVSVERPPFLLSLHLRHATERAAFGSTAMASLQPDMVSLTKARRERAIDTTEEELEERSQMDRIRHELEVCFGDAETAEEILDVLLHARGGQDLLDRFITERHPELSSHARKALHARWLRLRRRALMHLENRFGRETASRLFAA